MVPPLGGEFKKRVVNVSKKYSEQRTTIEQEWRDDINAAFLSMNDLSTLVGSLAKLPNVYDGDNYIKIAEFADGNEEKYELSSGVRSLVMLKYTKKGKSQQRAFGKELLEVKRPERITSATRYKDGKKTATWSGQRGTFEEFVNASIYATFDSAITTAEAELKQK